MQRYINLQGSLAALAPAHVLQVFAAVGQRIWRAYTRERQWEQDMKSKASSGTESIAKRGAESKVKRGMERWGK